jgi:RNA polymerase sigma-70 factor, ECF subfamily
VIRQGNPVALGPAILPPSQYVRKGCSNGREDETQSLTESASQERRDCGAPVWRSEPLGTMTAVALKMSSLDVSSAWDPVEAKFSSPAVVGYALAVRAVENEKPSAKADSGSEAALADLYAKYSPAIYAHCRRFLQTPAAARDATQEAFVRVLARGVVLPREEEALRYLYRVSTNVCLNLLREHNVHTRAVPSLAASVSHVGSAESSFADREFVNAVLDRCGQGGAQVAIMHYLDGMSQVEIAEVLGITRRTVFNRLRKLARIAGDLLRSVPKREGSSDVSKEGE